MRPWRSVAAATWHGRLTEKERKGEAKIQSLHDRKDFQYKKADQNIKIKLPFTFLCSNKIPSLQYSIKRLQVVVRNGHIMCKMVQLSASSFTGSIDPRLPQVPSEPIEI